MHIKNCRIDLTEPLEMHLNCDVKNLNILVGENGVGKSLYMKMVWLLGLCASHVSAMDNLENVDQHVKVSQGLRETEVYKNSQSPEFLAFVKSPEARLNILSDYYRNTFVDANFVGDAEIEFYTTKNPDDIGTFKLVFDNGEVTEFSYHFTDEMNFFPVPVFMSTSMRLFSQMETFFMVEQLGSPEQVLKQFRLYDLMYAQKFKQACPIIFDADERIDLTEMMVEMNESISKLGLSQIRGIDLVDGVIFLLGEYEQRVRASTLGNGVQAWLNMMVGARL